MGSCEPFFKIEDPKSLRVSAGRLERGILSVGQQMSQLLLGGHKPTETRINSSGSQETLDNFERKYEPCSCSSVKADERRVANIDDLEAGVVMDKRCAGRQYAHLNKHDASSSRRRDLGDEVDWWENRFTPGRNGAPDGMTWQERKHQRCGRKFIHPSCVPITIIVILILLVALLPLLDRDNVADAQPKHSNKKWKDFGGQFKNLVSHRVEDCGTTCKFSLVESIPEKMDISGANYSSTFESWVDLIEGATTSLDLLVFYWSLTAESTNSTHELAHQGEVIFESLKSVDTTKVRFRVAQNAPSASFPNTESADLPAEVRNVDIAGLTGGVQHSKMILVDGQHAYLGSANMDWRSLTQVKEIGLFVKDCPCVGGDLQKIFEIYWTLGQPGATIPDKWPEELDTEYNMDRPMVLTVNGTSPSRVSIGVSPPQFRTTRRDRDLDMILRLIETAEEFVYISVMDYFPTSLYRGTDNRYWDTLDTALRRAAFDRGVKVRVMASIWNSTRPIMRRFLQSLKVLEGSGIDIDTKLFRVPAYDEEQAAIPFARVNHNKYVVTESTAFMSTSNWSEDYFTNTGGIGVSITQDKDAEASLQRQLEAVFSRDWFSEFTEDP